MGRYVAFLRGINISGKNKISMAELKSGFESLGFTDVVTYLNSGNVAFTCDLNDARTAIEKMIVDKFGFSVPVYVIPLDDLADILSSAPKWWGTGEKEKYDNLIFILSEDTPEEICSLVGEPSEGLESVEVFENVIFWTFDRAKYQKCNWWKHTAAADVADRLTIRTCNTIKKICK